VGLLMKAETRDGYVGPQGIPLGGSTESLTVVTLPKRNACFCRLTMNLSFPSSYFRSRDSLTHGGREAVGV
jgi:hypothetical protein